ncbi:MAG: ribulose-phosphate 3-epimerase [Lachnospiraceae bacterium]|nr:ribulose-phosphate 3-epimerase [Lachnospiraceae bacterium]
MSNLKDTILFPSLLAADFLKIGSQLDDLFNSGINNLHFDVMDGHFVREISFGEGVLKTLSKDKRFNIDAHLMVTNPKEHIESFSGLGVKNITFHIETTDNPSELIELIHSYGIKAGVSIKPATSLESVLPFVSKADMILIMTVEPGLGGQSILPATIEKIKRLDEYVKTNLLNTKIQIDGGVTSENIKMLAESGAQYIVAGTAVFKGNITENVANIRKELNNASV